jgi:BirA family biotin operon repressor/biotin-[acetyl-CoA-carboxylase] ligase
VNPPTTPDAPGSLAPERVGPLLVGTAAEGWRLLGGGVTGSTQDDARALAGLADPGGPADPASFVPVAVLAERQTTGRGRFDRSWESPTGGVYFSALVRPVLAIEAAPALPLAAGLGIARGLEAVFADGLAITLKWPNDLRVSGAQGAATRAKLAGVLAESAVSGGHLAWVVIGCGINVVAPGSPAPGAAYLADILGERPAAARVAAAAIAGLAEALDTLALVGFTGLAGEYTARSDIIGAEVTVRDAGGRPVASGVVSGFDEAGRLVLSADGRIVTVAAGEVTLRAGR